MSTVAHPSAESRRAATTRVAAALLTEVGLARIALGVGALHVVDDNFLQPERGTSAGDHLWQLGTPYEDVAFTTGDGLRLQGWYVPSKNGAAVISFPGRKGPQKPARLLARHGYGVLLFDRRGEAESEGDPNLFGWEGTRDIEAAVAFLQTRPEVEDDRIGGLGLSVGGEMMLQEAAESDDMKAIVSEGAGIRSVREAVHTDGAEKLIFSWVSGIATLGTMVWTSNLPPRGLTDLSGEITEPTLFIHADPGMGGETLTEKYYEAAKGPKEYWKAPGGHTGAIDAAPEEYERRVVGFFDRTIGENAR